MTEIWASMPDKEMFAVAGLWRPTDEWGDCYTMVMTEACGEAATIHNRMPVILDSFNHEQWLYASIDDAVELCRPLTDALEIEHTSNRWAHSVSASKHK
jgi:putative SOS response-associated peptidase YedK